MGAGFSEPAPRWGHFSAVIENRILCVFGGRTNNFFNQKQDLVSTVYSFDPFLESWKENKCVGPPPPGLYRGTCTSADQYLYVHGGHDGWNRHSSIYRLDTNSWTWSQLCSASPVKKGGCGMVAYDNKLVLFGGYGCASGVDQPGATFLKDDRYTSGDGWTNEMFIYDLKNGTWSSPKITGTRPPPCAHFSFTMVDDHHAVLFGGNQALPRGSNNMYMLDLAEMHWTKLDHLGGVCPEKRSQHSAVCLGYGGVLPQLLIHGGKGAYNKILNDLWILDVWSGRWREISLPHLKHRCNHSAAAFTHNSDLVEVVIFGGIPLWPSDVKGASALPQTGFTTVLLFEYNELSAEDWVLTDDAHHGELGSKKRTKAKGEKLKTTRISAFIRAIVSDDDTEDETDSESFLQEIEELVSSGATVERKLAHSMLVGPNGSGKSSLMDRLLGRAIKELSLSTGVCSSVVMVDIDTENPSTFLSVTLHDPNTWEEVEYDISLVRQINKMNTTSKTSQVQLIPPKETTTHPIEVPNEDHLTPSLPASLAEPSSEPDIGENLQMEEVKSKLAAIPRSAVKLSDKKIREVIMVAVDKYGSFECFRKTFTGASLYLRDTGGQVEFQEMVSLLIFGPSIFLFVFRADLDFQSKFSIEYRVSEGESTNCYTSSITTEQALLQCLASVYAMDMSGKTDVKTHQPLVFIIGTHKDKLGPLAAEKLAMLNKHLDDVITKSGFQDLVQYADTSRGQVMFAVDNTSESDEDFKPIRSKIHDLISSCEDFTIEYPAAYLLFCLDLQNLKRSVLSLDECKAIASKYRIVGDEVSRLLQFLHLRIGVIQYFNVNGLRHIVVKEPQALFNIVTNLIIKTFSSTGLKTKEQRDFQRGILTASLLESAISSQDQITSQDFLKLLVHLRIIAPFAKTGEQEAKYFIPCVLNHIQESSEDERSTNILPLSVRFKCAHCPKGVFGVLITHLMSPMSAEVFEDSDICFTLIQDRIFKDYVSFDVSFHSDHDEVSLKLLSSHIEVNFYPSTDEDRDLSLGEICSNVRQIIWRSLLQSLKDLHYNRHNVWPMLCFKCEQCPELHRVKKMKSKDCHKMYCNKSRVNSHIPARGKCWFNEASESPSRSLASTTEGPSSSLTSAAENSATSQTSFVSLKSPLHNEPVDTAYVSSLPANVRAHLSQQLDWDHKGVDKDLIEIAHHMLDWEERLCAYLELTAVDVHDIKAKNPNNPELQRREALQRWKNKQGLELRATYGNLLELFLRAGHSNCAEVICEVLRRKVPDAL